jgi:hypothetical protein
MKTKSHKTRNEIHTLERFLRKRSLMIGVMSLLLFGMSHLDERTLITMRQAYVQGFGMLGGYLRENEPVRSPNFGFQNRNFTISGN